MNRLLVSTALAGAFFASSATAQSALPEGFDVNGHVALVYSGFSGSDDGETFALGDVDVSWTSGTFGLDVSAIGIATEDDSLSAFFGAVSYTFGDHKISVGMPRPAFDKYARFRLGQYSESSELLGNFLGSISLLTYFTLAADNVPFTILGLRYDGTFGQTDVAASIHGSPDGAGFLLSSSAQSQISTGVVSGGLDYLDVDDTQVTTVKLRYDTKIGLFDLGAGITNTSISNDGLPFTVSTATLELAADYAFTDHISAGGLWVTQQSSGGGMSTSTDSYGVRGKYAFGNGASANIAFLGSPDTSDTQYNLSLRYDF